MRKTPLLLLLSAFLTACPSASLPVVVEAPRAYVPRAIGAADTTVTLKGLNFNVKSASVGGKPASILEQTSTSLKLKLENPLGVGDFRLELTNTDGKTFSSDNGINAVASSLLSGEIDQERLVLTLKSSPSARVKGLLEAAGFVLEREFAPLVSGGTGICSQVIVTLKDSRAANRTVEEALNALAELLGPELNQGEFEPNPFVIERGPDASSTSSGESRSTPRAVTIAPDYSKLNLRVAVLDTGVSRHPTFNYLEGRISQSVVDFAAGRNFTLEGSGLSDVTDLRTGYPVADSGTSNVGHGTAVAAAIAAPVPSNQIGLPGVAPKVSILPVKVCDRGGNCGTPSLVAGICYAASLSSATVKPVKVLNFSIGGRTPNRLLYQALKDAAERGISVVVSAGNKALSGNPTIFPAAYANNYSSSYPAIPGLIVVGSISPNDGPFLPSFPSVFSSYGPWVSVSTEGEYVYLPNSSDLDAKNTYGYFTGTSFAAPLVAGMVVKIMQQRPTWSPAEIKKFLVDTANPVPNCPDNRCGAGQVNFDYLPNSILL